MWQVELCVIKTHQRQIQQVNDISCGNFVDLQNFHSSLKYLSHITNVTCYHGHQNKTITFYSRVTYLIRRRLLSS